MYKKLEKKFDKTIKLTKVLTYMLLFLSLIIGLYLIVALSTPSELFKTSEIGSKFLIYFNKSFSLKFIVSDFVNAKTKNEIKLIYSYIILNALFIVIFIDLIMYNILKFFKHSHLKGTPFNKDIIKYIDIIKWLIIALAILPDIIKSIFRYIVITKKDIIVFDNNFYLFILVFIALLLNVMKYIFLHGIKLQDEYDSLV